LCLWLQDIVPKFPMLRWAGTVPVWAQACDSESCTWDIWYSAFVPVYYDSLFTEPQLEGPYNTRIFWLIPRYFGVKTLGEDARIISKFENSHSICIQRNKLVYILVEFRKYFCQDSINLGNSVALMPL
jgi:hypothetical protein